MGSFLQDIPHLNWENEVYPHLSTSKDADIEPEFLGHIMEQGRCIGFILECIQYFREAHIEDYELCVKALDDLRGMELKRGDINFLIQYGRAVMVDFEGAVYGEEEEGLEREKRTN
jgi:hypothetical protein